MKNTEVDNATPVLWHFTNGTHLQTILEKGLLASDLSSFRTDQTDGLIRRTWLSAIPDSIQLSTSSKTSIPKELLTKLRQSINQGKLFRAFSCCFSENPIFDFMWETYAPDNGIAIAFDKASLELMQKKGKIILAKCRYNGYEETKTRAEQLGAILSKLNLSTKGTDLRYAALARRVVHALQSHARKAAFVKKSDFILDQETRLLFLLSAKEIKDAVFTDDGNHFNIGSNSTSYIRHIVASPNVSPEFYNEVKSITKRFGLNEGLLVPWNKCKFRTDRHLFDNAEINSAYQEWATTMRSKQ